MVLFGVSVNWLAVLVGAIVSLIIGFVWYSKPLFGNQWIEAMNIKKGTKMKMGPGPAAGAFVASLLSVFVLEVLIKAIHVTLYAIGIELAALIWLGFFFSMELVSLVFSRSNTKLFAINVAHHAVVLGVVALILVWMG